MNNYKVIEGRLNDNTIEADLSPAEIFDEVMNHSGVMVIKNVFPNKEAQKLRDLAFKWGQQQGVSSAEDFYKYTRKNHFCIQQGISKIQKTLHHYNSYNFNNYEELDNIELKELLMSYCSSLRDFYNSVTGNESDFKGDDKILHPQIIHYPSGGGFFARHTHLLEPQRIGLIVSLSQYGEDFNKGGTGFEVNNEMVDIESSHFAGDIGLFRFDIPHWVSPIDIEKAMDSNSYLGRWTLVLPYY